MLKIGEKQKLTVSDITEHGAFLVDKSDEGTGKTGRDGNGDRPERVLLPGRYVPEGIKRGDEIEVFLYRDSEDRPVATTDTPKLMLHEVGRLRVRETTRIGAFLDWGLTKDLLLPFGNQTHRVRAGEEVLCTPILDKSGRLAAEMNIYNYLEQSSPYSAGEWVTGTAYEKSREFGVFVAVDDRYSGLIPKKELSREVEPGETVKVRIKAILPDGRLSLSLREKAELQMDADAAVIMAYIEDKGSIPFTDKADPEVIRDTFGMTKSQFKRAVGRLLKQRRIRIGQNSITENT